LTPGARNYWKSLDFAELSDGLIETLVAYTGKLPSPHCEIFIAQMGGATSRIAPNATAYAHRDTNFIVNVHGRWENAEADNQCIGWARGFFNDAASYSTGGVYINFLTEEEKDRVRMAYKGNYERLVQLKNKYDPTNLFRMNQNIKPMV
jgi:hypothetical protein